MIKNILFDFGNVIINIDPQSVLHELARMGLSDGMELHRKLQQDDAYVRMEKDELSPAGFRDLVRKHSGKDFTDAQIDHAWNSIIKDLPIERIDLIERLKKSYKVFLLSNTNSIHYDHYNQYIREKFGYASLDAIFHRAWYSFRMGLYKPDLRIYEQVLREGGLIGEETLFIDDKQENVETAERVGIKGYHLKEGEDVTDLFEDGKLLISDF